MRERNAARRAFAMRMRAVTPGTSPAGTPARSTALAPEPFTADPKKSALPPAQLKMMLDMVRAQMKQVEAKRREQ